VNVPMRRIGLLGGMSWQSTALYYRLLNEGVEQRLGGLHSADCVVVSVDFDQIAGLQAAGRWTEAGEILADAARRAKQRVPTCSWCAPTPCTRSRSRFRTR
jgi:aspartate/glutamate racemase